GPDGFELHADPDLSTRLAKIPEDAELTIGIRPERITLHFEPDETFPVGHVHIVEPEGNDLIVSVRLGSTVWKVRTTTERAAGRLQPDMPISLQLEQARLNLFTADSHERAEVKGHGQGAGVPLTPNPFPP